MSARQSLGLPSRHKPSTLRLSLPAVGLGALALFFIGFCAGSFRAPLDVPALTTSSLKSQQETIAHNKASRRQLAATETSGSHEIEGIAFSHGESGDSHISMIPFQMVSWHPRAYVFPDFADASKCDAIVKLARNSLHRSGLALRPGETLEGKDSIRTSSGSFLSSSHDPSGALEWVERKMAAVTAIPRNHGEAFNVLRYETGQKYDSHMDVFDPKEYGPQDSNRIASFLLYLSDVEEGGETMFPYEGGQRIPNYNYKDCIGLKVKPKKGYALLFWSIYPNGTIDPAALHGSCPVIKGEKWVATKWIRDKPTVF